VIALEQQVGLYTEKALQQSVMDIDALSTVANWVYVWGHWPVIVAVLVWLFLRTPDRFVVYRNAMVLSGAIGVVIFAMFPVTPPRLLDVGLIDTVGDQSHAYRALQPPSLVNQYAAMPSFHVGWDLLMGVALVREARSVWLRALGCLLPLAMAWSVVVTANHYMLDGVVGSTIAVGSLVVVIGLRRRRLEGKAFAGGDGERERPAGDLADGEAAALQVRRDRNHKPREGQQPATEQRPSRAEHLAHPPDDGRARRRATHEDHQVERRHPATHLRKNG
jgi:membrane-associated phospholipid phosphatase